MPLCFFSSLCIKQHSCVSHPCPKAVPLPLNWLCWWQQDLHRVRRKCIAAVSHVSEPGIIIINAPNTAIDKWDLKHINTSFLSWVLCSPGNSRICFCIIHLQTNETVQTYILRKIKVVVNGSNEINGKRLKENSFGNWYTSLWHENAERLPVLVLFIIPWTSEFPPASIH